MSNIKGTIVNVKDFLSQEAVTIKISGTDELKNKGFTEAFLWVLEGNERARRFYESFGFIPTDDYLDDNIGGKDLHEIRYIYRLS